MVGQKKLNERIGLKKMGRETDEKTKYTTYTAEGNKKEMEKRTTQEIKGRERGILSRKKGKWTNKLKE